MYKVLNILLIIIFTGFLLHAEENESNTNGAKMPESGDVNASSSVEDNSGFSQPSGVGNCANFSGKGASKAQTASCGLQGQPHCALTDKECSRKDVATGSSQSPSSSGASSSGQGSQSTSAPGKGQK